MAAVPDNRTNAGVVYLGQCDIVVHVPERQRQRYEGKHHAADYHLSLRVPFRDVLSKFARILPAPAEAFSMPSLLQWQKSEACERSRRQQHINHACQQVNCKPLGIDSLLLQVMSAISSPCALNMCLARIDAPNS